MILNQSPWTRQLRAKRGSSFGFKLTDNLTTDIAIIGAGIAGVTTAFYALEAGAKQVILIEADHVAHGATGHNAGQVVSYFERSFADMVSEFGLDLAAAAQKDIESTWNLIDEIYARTGILAPLFRFTGYAGFRTEAQAIAHLKDNWYRDKANLPVETMLISENAPWLNNLPANFTGLYSVVEPKHILSLLETKDPSFVATLSSLKGCLNSALFVEQLLDWLKLTYGDKCLIFEQSPVIKINLLTDKIIIKTDQAEIKADKVILCTNGFENFDIESAQGSIINRSFHAMVDARIGYMSAYTDDLDLPPTAISYLADATPAPGVTVGDAEPYFYLTRRPFEAEKPTHHNLICIGGPETAAPDNPPYHRLYHEHPQSAIKDIRNFLKKTYLHSPPDTVSQPLDFEFNWHGLLGYTPNGIRRVGFDPRDMRLGYNLGCNGVGILPSIMGAHRIGLYLQGQKLAPSIFDISV